MLWSSEEVCDKAHVGLLSHVPKSPLVTNTSIQLAQYYMIETSVNIHLLMRRESLVTAVSLNCSHTGDNTILKLRVDDDFTRDVYTSLKTGHDEIVSSQSLKDPFTVLFIASFFGRERACEHALHQGKTGYPLVKEYQTRFVSRIVRPQMLLVL